MSRIALKRPVTLSAPPHSQISDFDVVIESHFSLTKVLLNKAMVLKRDIVQRSCGSIKVCE